MERALPAFVISISSFSTTISVSSLTPPHRVILIPPLMCPQRRMQRPHPFSSRNSLHWHSQLLRDLQMVMAASSTRLLTQKRVTQQILTHWTAHVRSRQAPPSARCTALQSLHSKQLCETAVRAYGAAMGSVCTCSRCKEWDLQQDPVRAVHNFYSDTNPGVSEACDTNKTTPSCVCQPGSKVYYRECV